MFNPELFYLADAKKGTKKTEQLQSKGIPILSEGFLAEVKKGNVDAMIKKFELLPTKAKVISKKTYFLVVL